MGDIMISFEEVTIPEELHLYMYNFNYGYLTKDKRIIFEEEPLCNDYWYDNYILQDADDLIETQTGNCFDQTEFARTWFEKNNYKVFTFHEQIRNRLDYSHSFLAYYDQKTNTYNWFETTWKKYQGIKKYKNLDALLRHQYYLYLETLHKNGIIEGPNIIVANFQKPKKHSTVEEYINNINKGKKLDLRRN